MLEATPKRRYFRLAVAWMFVGLSAALWIGIVFCYALRPDACAAVTIFPAWVWPLFGVLLAALSWPRREAVHRRSAVGIMLGLWLIFLLCFAEESRSIWRPVSPAARRSDRVRIVSLNCNAGDALAAAEATASHPDIVLLQEAPARGDVQQLARRVFGDKARVAWGPDGAILARGTVTEVALPPAEAVNFAQARVQLKPGVEVNVFSLRLLPAVFRFDLWSPACWRAQTANRRARRAMLQAIARRMNALPINEAIILGGDFNAPQGDAVFRELKPRLRDAFKEAGRGWGNTIINDFPVLRIDQIWISRHFQAQSVSAHSTANSDHRLVICDLLLTP